jgi:hypothetical protein
VHEFVESLIRESVAGGDVRADVPPDELAGYCLHALRAARTLSSKAAVRRLVTITLGSLAGDGQQPKTESDIR